jgi:hypothetical protein
MKYVCFIDLNYSTETVQAVHLCQEVLKQPAEVVKNLRRQILSLKVFFPVIRLFIAGGEALQSSMKFE